MKFEAEATTKFTLRRLHRRWVHRSRLIVSFPVRGDRHSFWRRRRPISPQNLVITPQIIPTVGTNVRKSAVEIVDFDKKAVLERLAVGVCMRLISLELLAVGLESDQIRGFHLMWLSGSRVLLIFQDIQVRTRVVELPTLDNWFESDLVWCPRACKSNRRVWLTMYGISVHAWAGRTFENIASLWGNFVRIDGETSDTVSFERARVLIETDRGAIQFDRVDALVSESEEVDQRQEKEVKSDEISLCAMAVQDTNQDGSQGHYGGSILRLGSDVARVGDQNEAGLELGLFSIAMDKDT
ncbi:hypothetical protein V6N11_080440 [Hibiscus sabdariffa]|uniref:DUF4283 domain-containing protein n=1 Tax=Hibiscus sabdariffa TaxID=183260 RepID=A0ABR2R863_9ROSI